jgi:lipopolysaccharide export LptBFGC system permease protein LptF
MLAVVIGLSYWLGSNVFAQIGMYGLAPAFVAVFILPFFFFLVGIYFFSKART